MDQIDSPRLLLFSNSTQHGRGHLAHGSESIRTFLGDSVRQVLFVPYARADWDGYAASVGEAFESFGYQLLSIHAAPSPAQAVADAEAFFVGGGNTFRLLKTLQDDDLLRLIAERVAAGVPYMGASAGSNLACPTIRTTNDMPIVEPRDLVALGLLPFQINAHYLDPDPDSTHQGETREERIAEFHQENVVPVLGIREGAWLQREGEALTLRGATGARLFRRGEVARELGDGADLTRLLQDAEREE